VQVSEAGDMAVVSVLFSRGRDAVSKVCRALEPLRLRVVTATFGGDNVVHTMFVLGFILGARLRAGIARG
jgi:hypothetical protein